MEIAIENCEDDDTRPARNPPPSATEHSLQVAAKDNARLSCEPGRRTATATAAGGSQRSTESASAVSNPGTALETTETSRRHAEGQARESLTEPPSGQTDAPESSAQPTARERISSGAVASSPTQRSQAIAAPLIEESPPLYSSLFPPATRSTANNTNCQPQPRLDQSQTIQQHPPFAQRCSVCYTTQPPLSHDRSPHLYHHHHLHHTPGSPLPGMIGQHYPEHYPPREQPQYHTIVPMHPGAERHNDSHDYTKLSFLCVLVCTLHLNLPALLCVLPALAYSIRAQKLNAERRYRRAGVYGRSALTCNLLAVGQYVVCVVAAAIVGLYILFNDYLL